MAQSELTADVFRALLEKQGLTVPEADLRAALPPASRLLDQANRLTESQDG